MRESRKGLQSSFSHFFALLFVPFFFWCTDALSWFEKALARDPHKSHLYFNKGLALEYLKRYEESISCFDLSIKYDPNNIENYYEKVSHSILLLCSSLLLFLSPSTFSSFWFRFCYPSRQLISSCPHFHSLLLPQAKALKQLRKYEQAIQVYDILLMNDPEDVDVLNLKGNIYFDYLDRFVLGFAWFDCYNSLFSTLFSRC